jgi:hypothetical protein
MFWVWKIHINTITEVSAAEKKAVERDIGTIDIVAGRSATEAVEDERVLAILAKDVEDSVAARGQCVCLARAICGT